MKKSLVILAMSFIWITGCQTDQIKKSIPGTYTRSFTQEFSTAQDTIVIQPSETNKYTLTRKTGYRLLVNGEAGAKRYKNERMIATYDPATKILNEHRHGKMITMYPDSGYILVMSAKYRRIN